MLATRAISLFLRFGEFVSGAVVLGLVAHFLWQRHHYHTGPLAREIYTEVVAALSVVLSLLWMIPTLHNLLHYPMDFVLAAAWFAAFGVLVEYLDGQNCGGVFHWGGLAHGGYCSQWKAAEAFSFISACFWLASMLLGIYAFHVVRKRSGRTARV